MASGQGHGLQISLVIFVILTLGTGVAAFLFFQQSQQYDAQKAEAQQRAKNEDLEKRKAVDAVSALAKKIGAPEGASFGDVNDAPASATPAPPAAPAASAAPGQPAAAPAPAPAPAAATVMALFNGQIAEARTVLRDTTIETYEQALGRYDDELRNVREQFKRLQDNDRMLDDEATKSRAIKDTVVATNQQARDDAEAKRQQLDTELKTELDKMNKDHEATRAAAQKAAIEKEQWIQKRTELEKQYQTDITKWTTLIRDFRLAFLNSGLKDQPDGEVVTVNAPQKTVHLTLGEADGLRGQELFSVWSPAKRVTPYYQKKDAKDKKTAEQQTAAQKKLFQSYSVGGPKAGIEILQVTGPHSSIARIHWDTPLDPIVPNDDVYSPLWSAEKKQRFCLVGIFDLTGKGKNDRELLKKIIQRHGGIIDCELKDDGTVEGAISAQTDWFVRGAPPAATEGTAAAVQQFTQRQGELESEAEKLGVQVLTADELYTYSGYRQQTRIYEPGATTAAPKPYDLEEKKSSASASGSTESQ